MKSRIRHHFSVANISSLNLTAKESRKNRAISLEVTRQSFPALMKDIKILRRHSSQLSRMVALKIGEEQFTLFHAKDKEFSWHPVAKEDFFQSSYLEKILARATERKPEDYETLLATEGVGPKTMRVLSLVAEVIYGTELSHKDPARYSFSREGKDVTSYPVDRATYDETSPFSEMLLQEYACHCQKTKDCRIYKETDKIIMMAQLNYPQPIGNRIKPKKRVPKKQSKPEPVKTPHPFPLRRPPRLRGEVQRASVRTKRKPGRVL